MKAPPIELHARCGCGCGVFVRGDREAECPNCRWPILYQNAHGDMVLSRHADFEIRRDRTTSAKTDDA